MRKEMLGLVGILGLSGCMPANGTGTETPGNLESKSRTYAGIATSYSECQTIEKYYIEPFFNTVIDLSYKAVVFEIEVKGDSGKVRDFHVFYSSFDEEQGCKGFPMIFADDSVRVGGAERKGSALHVYYPEGIVHNLSRDDRY